MLYSFIHSRIYIALLQGDYSEALPTLAWQKRTVLSLIKKNVLVITPASRRSSCGSPFQTTGPITEKALFCIVAVRANGTKSNPFCAIMSFPLKYRRYMSFILIVIIMKVKIPPLAT